MKRKIKYVGVVILSMVLCLGLHLITPPALTSGTPVNTLSSLALTLGLPLTALLWAGIAYSCVALGFYFIKERIPGKGGLRGLRYGISIGLLWLLGYVMCVPVFGNPFINEFVGGLCDAIPVVVMGWLLGLPMKNDIFTETKNSFSKKQAFIGIAVFILTFFLARLFSYNINILDTGFRIDAVYALVWTAVMGFCLGITYILLGKTTKSSTTLAGAFKFGLLLFGLTWGAFIVFFPLVLKDQLINTIVMFLIDALAVTTAYYISEILITRLESRRIGVLAG